MKAYHGTTKENARKICAEGFSPDYFGQNGNHFGDGIYLTTTKKRARVYGSHVVTVEIDDTNIENLTDWYGAYMDACNAEFDKGTPQEEVNSAVGRGYREKYTQAGFAGISLSPPVGTGKEMVIYDTAVIKEVRQ